MLEQLGGECAGAVTFIPAGEKLSEQNHSYKLLTDADLARVLRELPRRPLMAGADGIRLSLAGAQDKIAVHVEDDQISVPLGGAPSTHILKPAIAHFEGLVFNEALCMTLATSIGLPAASVETRRVEDIDYLLIKRYDRKVSGASIERLHQEDFCQALGIISEHKYQREGGPSLKSGFGLIRDISSTPVIDLQRFLDAVIFNFLVGNHDAHGKNFSFIYDHSPALGLRASIAPLYDIVCTSYYPELSQKMAMKIGGEYESEMVHPRSFEKMADECGLAKPLVKKRILELSKSVIAALDTIEINHPVAEGVKSIIKKHCLEILQTFKA